MELQLPRTQQPALARFIALPPEARERLIARLQTSSPVFRADKLAEQIGPELSIDADELTRILRMFASMYSARLSNNVSAAEFAKSVMQAAVETGRKDLQIPGEQRNEIEASIAAVLDSEAFLVTAKAANIAGEFERIFNQARILTDLRPIFNDPSKKPVAALVVHTLRIAYEDVNGLSEFFVSVHSKDIEKLIETLQRAIEKERALRASMSDEIVCLTD
jgi:hypothetical protein